MKEKITKKEQLINEYNPENAFGNDKLVEELKKGIIKKCIYCDNEMEIEIKDNERIYTCPFCINAGDKTWQVVLENNGYKTNWKKEYEDDNCSFYFCSIFANQWKI